MIMKSYTDIDDVGNGNKAQKLDIHLPEAESFPVFIKSILSSHHSLQRSISIFFCFVFSILLYNKTNDLSMVFSIIAYIFQLKTGLKLGLFKKASKERKADEALKL